MHVAHLVARLNVGGPARVIAALAKRGLAAGQRVSVLAGAVQPGEDDASAWLCEAGITVQTVPGLGRRLSPLADLRALLWLLGWLRARRPTVLHTHTAKAGALGRVAAALLGIPCLHTYHGHVLKGYYRPAISRALAAAERLLATRSHLHALCPSQWHDLHQRCRIGAASRWHVLPIPVEPLPAAAALALPGLRAGVPVLLFLGRLAAVKDIALWLESLAVAARLGPVQGLVCGSGPDLAHAQQHAARLGVSVVFAGVQPAAAALATSSLLLLSSRNEGQSVSVIEAWQQGVGVVAPAVGGLGDMAAGGAICLARRDAHSLGTAVAGLLADQARRAALVAAGRRAALRHDPDKLFQRYAGLYAQLAEGKR